MKLIVNISLFLALTGIGYSLQATERPNWALGQVWAHLESDWREAPLDAGIQEATAWANLIAFRPGEKFIWLNCLLIRQGDEIRVSQGDPVVIYIGRWKATKSGAEIKYREYFRTVKIVGKKIPGPLERSRVEIKKESLVLRDREFKVLKGLEIESFESAVSQVARIQVHP